MLGDQSFKAQAARRPEQIRPDLAALKAQNWTSSSCLRECSALKSETPSTLRTTASLSEHEPPLPDLPRVADQHSGELSGGVLVSFQDSGPSIPPESTVAIYLAEDGLRRLAAFPISQTEYDRWQEEWFSYERLMGKHGKRASVENPLLD
jgi:hypothetical protein